MHHSPGLQFRPDLIPRPSIDDAYKPRENGRQPRPFLTAEWRNLAMVNYEIDPALLAPYVPFATELDAWQGRTFISIVGFMFLDTRVRGWSIPGHREFEEVNLRFYVRCRTADGWRRGVVFIKEIAPRRAVTAIARLVYNENYVTMPMRHSVEGGDERSLSGGATLKYEWRHRGKWNGLIVRVKDQPKLAATGSHEQFITEHYFGYTVLRDGTCMEYRVDHPPWRIWPAAGFRLNCDVKSIYGQRFVEPLAAKPVSAFVAEGSEVAVQRGLRL